LCRKRTRKVQDLRSSTKVGAAGRNVSGALLRPAGIKRGKKEKN